MILVYKSTSSVDNVANDEIKDKLKQGLTNHNLLKGLKYQSLVMVITRTCVVRAVAKERLAHKD